MSEDVTVTVCLLRYVISSCLLSEPTCTRFRSGGARVAAWRLGSSFCHSTYTCGHCLSAVHALAGRCFHCRRRCWSWSWSWSCARCNQPWPVCDCHPPLLRLPLPPSLQRPKRSVPRQLDLRQPRVDLHPHRNTPASLRPARVLPASHRVSIHLHLAAPNSPLCAVRCPTGSVHHTPRL